MKYVVVAVCLFVALGSAAEIDKCAWGESYWCSDLHAAKTCGAFKHCTSTVWKNQQLVQDGSEVCDFCEAIVDDARRFVADNRTAADVTHFLISACGVIPEETVAATCKLMVQEFTPNIMQMLSEDISPQVICSLLKICNGLEDTMLHNKVPSRQDLIHVPLKKAHTPVVVGESQTCTDCKKFLSDIRAMITDKTEMEVIEQILEHDVCPFFGIMKSKCVELVKAYLPLWLEYVAQVYDPNFICHLFRFCTEAVQHPVDANVMEFFELLKKTTDDECEKCKTILSEIQAMIRNPAIQQTIVNILKIDVCPLLQSAKNECVALINRFAPTVFEYIAKALDPDARCRGFGFCNSSLIGDVGQTSLKFRATKPRKASENECELCELVVNELENLIANNATEEEITHALDKVCSLMPNPLGKECKDFVDKYVPVIITMIRQEVDAEEICKLLGLCSKNAVAAPLKDDDTCLICETVVQYIEAMLDDKTSVDEIEKLLDKVCNFLPDSMKSQCVTLVNTYGPMIIHLIATEYTPEQVCKIAKLCSSAANNLPMVDLTPGKPVLVGTNHCTYGPAYWCATPKNAQQCDAVEHCKKYVWKN